VSDGRVRCGWAGLKETHAPLLAAEEPFVVPTLECMHPRPPSFLIRPSHDPLPPSFPFRSHIASLLNAGHLIPPLLHARADVSIKDNSGRTAEQLAHDKSSDEVLKQFSVLSL